MSNWPSRPLYSLCILFSPPCLFFPFIPLWVNASQTSSQNLFFFCFCLFFFSHSFSLRGSALLSAQQTWERRKELCAGNLRFSLKIKSYMTLHDERFRCQQGSHFYRLFHLFLMLNKHCQFNLFEQKHCEIWRLLLLRWLHKNIMIFIGWFLYSRKNFLRLRFNWLPWDFQAWKSPISYSLGFHDWETSHWHIMNG